MSELARVAASDLDAAFERVVAVALDEDLGGGPDITTTSVVPDDTWADASLVAKASGVVCGLAALHVTFAELDRRVVVSDEVRDGDEVEPGDVLARLRGPAQPILTGERTALNILSHLSGVATKVRSFVRRASSSRITETRKTLPGLRALQKYAVVVGGGNNHRFALWDGVLIKDNHIVAAGSVAEAIRRAKASTTLPIEVECTTREQVDEAIDAGADEVLLDNRDIAQMTELTRHIRGRAPGVLVEASGNVDQHNVADVAATGVDRISVGAFTHSAPALDVSLRFENMWRGVPGGEAPPERLED